MSQILRPIATTISTGIASGDHTSVDESSPSDTDYVRTNVLVVDAGYQVFFETLLSPPIGRPGPGNSIWRFRWQAEIANGANLALMMRLRIYQGATQITSNQGSIGDSFENQWFTDALSTLDLSAITDWSDVRANFAFATTEASSPLRGRLSFTELEVPDALSSGGWF